MRMKQKKIQNGRFSKSPILEIFLPKFHKSVVVRVMVEVEPKNYQIFALNKMDVMDFGGWVQMPVLPIWWIQLQMF